MTVERKVGPPAANTGVEAMARERQVASQSLVMQSDPTSGAAEAIRALRTHLMAQHVQAGRRALALCAVSPGVGCSFVAANLAVALAQIGVKTLLIDGNLRSPSMEAVFLVDRPTGGLAPCMMSDDSSFSDHIQVDLEPNLSVLFSRGCPPNPQEILAGNRFSELMDFCLREYEVTLVDTPPANTCADARRISTVTGYSLLIARKNLTFVEDLKTLAEQLQADHAKIVGTVLNEA